MRPAIHGVACLLLLLVACDEAASTPAASAGPAGSVKTLVGTATATRAGASEARPLAVGAEVFADDTIRTEDGSEIDIVLNHNGAEWHVEGKGETRVDKSIAWAAPKASEPELLSAAGPDTTRAAGRDGERQAGDTTATAPKTKLVAGDEPEPTRTPETTAASKTERSGETASDSPRPPKKPKRKSGSNAPPKDDKKRDDDFGLGGLGLNGSESSSFLPKNKRDDDKRDQKKKDDDSDDDKDVANIESAKPRQQVPPYSKPLAQSLLRVCLQGAELHGHIIVKATVKDAKLREVVATTTESELQPISKCLERKLSGKQVSDTKTSVKFQLSL